MKAIIKAAIFTPGPAGWGLPLCFWGEPGVGKSAIIEETARECGLKLKILSPGEQGEGAFGVTPVPVTMNGTTVITYPIPDWVFTWLNEPGERGLLFLDELSTASPSVQAAILGLIQARRIGGGTMPNGIRILAASNDVEESAGGLELAMPTANRMGHIKWTPPPFNEWCEWLVGHDPTVAPKTSTPDSSIEERVLSVWSAVHSKYKGIVSAFIRSRPDLLQKKPAATDPAASRAWSSRRTWEMATRAMASAEIHQLSPADRATFISAFIGQGAYAELLAFTIKHDLPDPIDILEGRVKFKHNPKQLDYTMAVISGCAAVLLSPDCENFDKRCDNLAKALGGLCSTAPDIIFLTIRLLTRHDGKVENGKPSPTIARARRVEHIFSKHDALFEKLQAFGDATLPKDAPR